MLTDSELLALMTDLESDRVERTRSTSDTDKFSQAICAFSNDMPAHSKAGYLLIGVSDNGALSGLKADDNVLKNLGGMQTDGNIRPQPSIQVTVHRLDGGDVIVVEAQPSKLPPVRYKGLVWIRIGPRKSTASEDQEKILSERRVSSARSFDALPCLDSGLDDVATDLFVAYRRAAVDASVIAENHRDIGLQLSSLRFFDLKNQCPTNAGILLFGINPLAWMPGAYVQFLRVRGITLADPIGSEKELSGDLASVLRRLDDLLDAYVDTTPVAVTALREESSANYPRAALRELLLNAVLHRDYQSTAPIRFYWFDDRVEIQNPGGLYGEATRENFPKQNSYRNPVVAETMKTLGYVNRYGRGVMTARQAMMDTGLPAPEFVFDPGYFLVTLRGR
jgi:ATP-dependent DNA helicase RecG